ncbi:MAG: putative alpha/beta hydrolase [Myxococcales bacterium]|nr:putative alpha/beta hydrolase [Myxococcales bacterium]
MRARLVFSIALLVVTNAPALAKPRWQTLPLPPAMPKADTKGTVTIKGGTIYYATFGTGAPVILLHGGMGNGDHFSRQVPALRDKFQVIVIDSRGQGRSSLPKGKLSYHAMASDVLAVMDKLSLPRASLVGWSDGGAIGLDLAVTHPDRVDKLFIIGTNYDGNGSKPRKGKPPAATFLAYTAKCRADHARFGNKPKSFSAAIDALLPVWRNPGGFTKDQLRGITAPTMVALGDHDEIIELDQIKEMAELIPNGELTVFADTSHFAMWQDPKSFNKVLIEFLTAKPE